MTAYDRAHSWATEHAASGELAERFALDYAQLVDELDPTATVPTPAQFADDNVLDYGPLVDTTTYGTVIAAGTGWIARCTACSWNPGPEASHDFATAEHAAAVHNSEIHSNAPRPQWSDVATWAASHAEWRERFDAWNAAEGHGGHPLPGPPYQNVCRTVQVLTEQGGADT